MQPMDPEQLHILVIDDDPKVCQLIVDILLPNGHQVITANSAEQGLEQLPFFTFQVAFLDHNLPGMEGLVFGEYLRRNNPHMRIAMVTGAADDRLHRIASEHDIHVINKPFDIGEILDVVTAYKEAAEARHERAREVQAEDFAPPLSRFCDELADLYGMPNLPNRVGDQLVFKLKELLNHLGSIHRYSERERVAALSGLLAARVLGVDLPKLSNGNTMFEEYDRLMAERGRRREFGHYPPEVELDPLPRP